MAKPTEAMMKRFPSLYNIKPEDFESVFNTLSSGQIPNLMVLSADIVSVVKWVRQKLGEPVLKVQLTNDQIGVCYEEAYLQFSAEIETIVAQNNMLDVYGKNKYTNLTDKAIHTSFNFYYDSANYLADQSVVGGASNVRKAYLAITSDTQSYSMLDNAYDNTTGQTLRAYFLQNNMVEPIQVIKVYYEQPVGYTNYPSYGGNVENFGVSLNSMVVGGVGGGTQSQIYPNWDNYLWKQHSKQFSELRRSAYRYDLRGEYIDLIPSPMYANKIYFEYRENKNGFTGSLPQDQDSFFNDGISNFSNIPLHELAPELINSVGKNWMRKYCLALSKELLGLIRNTYSSGIRMPTGDEISLNGDQLISDAKAEQDKLIDDLRLLLEKFDVAEMIERKVRQVEANTAILGQAPLMMYVG